MSPFCLIIAAVGSRSRSRQEAREKADEDSSNRGVAPDSRGWVARGPDGSEASVARSSGEGHGDGESGYLQVRSGDPCRLRTDLRSLVRDTGPLTSHASTRTLLPLQWTAVLSLEDRHEITTNRSAE